MNRGRPEKLTDELQDLITRIKFEHPKRTMREIRSDIRLYLVSKIQEQNPHLKKQEIAKMVDSPDGPLPGESAISKYLTQTVRNIQEHDPLDDPWSISGMANHAPKELELRYKLSAQDIEAILRVRAMQLRRDDIKKSMSTRQALWIARLWARTDKIDFSSEVEKDPAYWLWRYSFEYAIREKVANLSEHQFNSRDMDDALAQGHEKFKETYEKGDYANWKDVERFYKSHFLNGETEYRPIKDGGK